VLVAENQSTVTTLVVEMTEGVGIRQTTVTVAGITDAAGAMEPHPARGRRSVTAADAAERHAEPDGRLAPGGV
jgi:hypothetical protein